MLYVWPIFRHDPSLLRVRWSQLSSEEQKGVLGAFTNPEETQAKGIRLAGEKFFTLQANERSVYGKKRVRGSIHFLSSRVDG
jgi:hypothetical protein